MEEIWKPVKGYDGLYELRSKAAGHRSTKVTQAFYAQIHKDTVLQEIASVI